MGIKNDSAVRERCRAKKDLSFERSSEPLNWQNRGSRGDAVQKGRMFVNTFIHCSIRGGERKGTCKCRIIGLSGHLRIIVPLYSERDGDISIREARRNILSIMQIGKACKHSEGEGMVVRICSRALQNKFYPKRSL